MLMTGMVLGVVAQKNKNKYGIKVIGYYSGDAEKIERFPIEKLSHIIFSFCHLRGSELSVDKKADSLSIQKLVLLKKRNPNLKVLLSLGGWGGCKNCSEIFSKEKDRKLFAQSVKKLTDHFGTDGIDLDWEYPAIEGYPGHQYMKEDKNNFTALIKDLRKVLGKYKQISFAAGGFKQYLESSIDWRKVMPLVDGVNLMTYDLVNGATPHTGHLTPLYSTTNQIESADACVRYLASIGIPKKKMVLGAAFYGRTWRDVENVNNGLHQTGIFESYLPYDMMGSIVNEENGFTFYSDSLAKASYAYNSDTKVFATFDDATSIITKTKYIIANKLGGIMFWELAHDKPENGFLDLIDQTLKTNNSVN